MEFTKEQAEVLLNWMEEMAKAAIEDHEYRHSDYAGYEIRKIKERSETFLTQLNSKD